MLRCLIILCVLIGIAVASASDAIQQDDAVLRALRDGGCYVLMRHAITDPGVGDPPGFDVNVRASQRNLSETGKAQSTRIGRAMKAARVDVSEVWTSPWFRCRDTATLIVETAGWTVPEPKAVGAFRSFFQGTRADREAAAQAMRRLVIQPVERGNVLVVTHQVNITELTDIVPLPGEAVVIRPDATDGFAVVGRIQFDTQK